MSKFISVGLAVMVLAAPVSAQFTRGSVEFGGFASRTQFGTGLKMNDAWGGGGRVGAFINPSLSVEFEGSASHSTRPSGLLPVNSSVLTARMTANPITIGRLGLLVGGGIDHTDAYFIESYGANFLLGGRFRLADYLSLRVDGILSGMSVGKHTNRGLHFGLSMFRGPNRLKSISYIDRLVVGPSVAQRPDSVSAYETARLRAASKQYQALRDSLRMDPVVIVPLSSAAALATMNQMIHFPREGFALSDSAKQILDEKVVVFNANPDMRIIITGYTSAPGTAEYNMALGLKRATVAKEYLVSRGVDPIRVEISTRGEGRLLVEGPGEAANAENRRTQFRLLVADPYLDAPKKP